MLEASIPANSSSCRRRDRPRSTRDHLLAGAAFPDADGLAFHRVLRDISMINQTIEQSLSGGAYLAAEGASVSCVLGDFHLRMESLHRYDGTKIVETHLFDLLTQGGTVTLSTPNSP